MKMFPTKMMPTLGRYLAREYLKSLVFLVFVLLAIVFLFDCVELIRRASKRGDVSLGLVFQMALLKLPEEGQVMFPFAVLYSAMVTFWQMTRRYELIVVRAAGFSAWQFLMPVMAVAVLAGLVHIAVINPVGSVLVSRYKQLEAKYIETKSTEIALFREGFWLRQAADEGYVILHSPRIQQRDWLLRNPVALFFSADDRFLKRIDAQSARLESERWVFDRPVMHDAKGSSPAQGFILPTTLTQDEVEKSFSSPAAMSFWRLPAHIQTLEETGFDSRSLRVHYQGLLAQPFLFVAMVLIAAAVSLRPPRSGQGFLLVSVGIMTGFVLFFMSSFLQAMGTSHQIPVVLAAWAPSLIALLLGLSILMRQEDG